MPPTIQDHLFLDSDNQIPVYRQIHAWLREAIEAGSLPAGARLPSTRALAQQLGLARGTVAAAYALLNAEGYLEAHGQAGSRVAARRAGSGRSAPESGAAGPAPAAFQLGLPALDAFPRKVWGRLAARAARATQVGHMLMAPYAGMPALRSEIARYLRLARGIDCAADQVFVTSGYGGSLQLVARALLAPGQQVWTEDPGYPPTSALLRAAGLAPVPVAVDRDGLQVWKGLALAPAARAAIVTPAHQYPLGAALSAERRHALLQWAGGHDGWVVECDHDGEFRYAGRALPALASWDKLGRVVYCGSFSKVLFPAIRLAYVVAPPGLVAHFGRACAELSASCPALTQTIVSDFMREGHFVRHIRQMRKLYGERRQWLADALADVLGPDAPLAAPAGGLHLALPVQPGADQLLAARLHHHGMAPQALSGCYAGAAAQSGLLLGFTNIVSAAQAAQLGRLLAQLIGEWRR